MRGRGRPVTRAGFFYFSAIPSVPAVANSRLVDLPVTWVLASTFPVTALISHLASRWW